MIVDILERRLRERRALVPVEALLNNCEGSRMPEVEPALLTEAIARRVVEVCPTAAFTLEESGNGSPAAAQTDTAIREGAAPILRLSYAECIGCRRCMEVGEGAMVPARSFPWTGVSKAQLVRRWDIGQKSELPAPQEMLEQAGRKIRSMLGRALNIRQLDPGSCNGCEAEITALTNPYYDLERFGIHFVASPKHADMLLVTGPVTRNMLQAVKETYEAVPAPKLVVAVGACGCSGGIFANSYAVVGPVDAVIPVDAYIPGCPPTPAMLVTGILRVLQHRQFRGANH
ncbi:MAG: NADH-quinone oxidoreductase subunit B family protein [Acidobacteriales bacterium]|nr:NADH-quinone oxidoreductase subunit B family protein [Terriglobales bacterium]